MFIAAQFTIAKYWKQPKCPSANEWIKKLWYIYTMEFYAAESKKELIPFTIAWMELESVMLSEISQAVRDKYYAVFLYHLFYNPLNLCQHPNWSGMFTQKNDPSHHFCKIQDPDDPVLSGSLQFTFGHYY